MAPENGGAPTRLEQFYAVAYACIQYPGKPIDYEDNIELGSLENSAWAAHFPPPISLPNRHWSSHCAFLTSRSAPSRTPRDVRENWRMSFRGVTEIQRSSWLLCSCHRLVQAPTTGLALRSIISYNRCRPTGQWRIPITRKLGPYSIHSAITQTLSIKQERIPNTILSDLTSLTAQSGTITFAKMSNNSHQSKSPEVLARKRNVTGFPMDSDSAQRPTVLGTFFRRGVGPSQILQTGEMSMEEVESRPWIHAWPHFESHGQ